MRIALGNCTDRALRSAAAAADAGITDYTCHFFFLLKDMILIYWLPFTMAPPPMEAEPLETISS
jgi:hypothetical protein